MRFPRNFFNCAWISRGEIIVERQTVSCDPNPSEKLEKLIRLDTGFGLPSALMLAIKRQPVEQAQQLKALKSGKVDFPNSFVDYGDKINREDRGVASSLRMMDAKVYDTYHRCASQHRFLRHDVWLSVPMYNEIRSIFMNEWNFSEGWIKDGEFQYLPHDRPFATLIFEDIGKKDVLSMQPNPATSYGPGTTRDIQLASRPLLSISLVRPAWSDAANAPRECIKLLETRR